MLDSNLEYPILGYIEKLGVLTVFEQMRRFQKQMLFGLFAIVCICLYFFFRETTFQECVLNHVKDSRSDSAALVYRMCKEKYADKSKNHTYIELNQFELSLLTGRAGPKHSGSEVYGVNLYNGNEGLTISEVNILVVATPKKGDSVSREYKNNVSIAPKSTGEFSFNFIVGDVGSSYDWYIASAKGYKK